jgi:serine/threonine-protein kinase
VPVDPNGLVGRPVDQVRTQLTELGLVPRLTAVTTSSVPGGQVTAVAPSGLLARGSEVTVSYAVAPAAAPTTAAPTTTAPAPAPAPAPKPTKTHHKKGGDD